VYFDKIILALQKPFVPEGKEICFFDDTHVKCLFKITTKASWFVSFALRTTEYM